MHPLERMPIVNRMTPRHDNSVTEARLVTSDKRLSDVTAF
jgi:hypothetical protein